jgi:superfamily II DNA or RNA helicase
VLDRLVPRPDQEEDIAHILSHTRTLCASQLGVGKTLTAVEAAHRSGAKTVLVVAPLVTFRGWAKTIESQTGATPRTISSKVAGTLAFSDLSDGVPGWYLVGWEFMRTLDWSAVPVDYLILDEVARIANRKAQQSKAVKRIPAENILALSATPFGNSPDGAWSVLNCLWPKEFPPYWSWVTKYLRTERSMYSRGPKPLGEKQPGIVVASIPSWIRREAPYDIPLAVHEIEVTLPPAQMKVYRQFEREAVVWLEENPLIADLPAVQYARLRQITLAMPSIRTNENGSDEVYFAPDAKSAKIDALLRVIEDLPDGEPGLVWSHSKKFIDLVALRLREKGYTAEAFTGDTPRAERERIRDAFGKDLQFICATIQAAGTGLDGFQLVCRVEHVMSLDDNRQNNIQAWGRLSRGGQTRRVNRFLYRAADTIELRQNERLRSDDQMMSDLLERSLAA